jgi:hypothetical protein
VSWDVIINPGSSKWRVVERDKPSADLSSNACHGLPDVSDDQNVSDPLGTFKKVGHVDKADKWGRPVVTVEWALEGEYGSRYKGGGAFIRVCWVTVPTCFVGFGYDLQLNVRVEDPQNKGSATAPVALLRIHIEGTLTSRFTTETLHSLVAIRGDGAFQF